MKLLSMDAIMYFTRAKVHGLRTYSMVNIPVQLIQIVLLIYLSIKQNGNVYFWLILPVLALATLFLWWLDEKYLYKAECDYTIDSTTMWDKVKNDLDEIKNELKELKEKTSEKN